MSAPFDLPDRMTVWNPTDDTILYENLACRQVPMLFGPHQWYTSGTNSQVSAPTHWVDYNVGPVLLDGASRAAAFITALDLDDGVIIEFDFGGPIMRLRVIWHEIRFSNTPNEYMRAYCHRMSFNG